MQLGEWRYLLQHAAIKTGLPVDQLEERAKRLARTSVLSLAEALEHVVLRIMDEVT